MIFLFLVYRVNEFASSNSALEPDIIQKMKNNTLNPFSLNGSGKQYVTTNPKTDPDGNYFNQFTLGLDD